MLYKDYKVTVPGGKSGDWKVERFTVDKEDAIRTAIGAIRIGRGYVRPGEYTRLVRKTTIVMSDTRDEIHDHLNPVLNAKGRVLIAGLGLGVVLQGILRRGDIEHVTVIEKASDVIKLVAGHYYEMFNRARLTIVNADIFEWNPPKEARWDYAWFDIWDSIDTDNRSEFTKLRRKFGQKCKVKKCWCEERVERTYQHEKRAQRRYGYWAF